MKVSERIIGSDICSTTLAAFALSLIWHGVWLFVFFFSTWIANFETSKNAFIMVLWLSAAAESFVRFSENSKWVAALVYKEGASPGVRQHGFDRTIKLLSAGFMMVLLFTVMASADFDLIKFDKPLAFAGMNGMVGAYGMNVMFNNWMNCLSDSIIIGAVGAVGTSIIIRALIYKRRK